MQAPADLCPPNCQAAAKAKLVFRSIPKVFLSDYGEKAKCNELLEKTRATPLTYHDKFFADIAKFNEWFGQFSQGKGSEGSDLYHRCDGACSPQYRSILDILKTGYQPLVEVVCGPARDKSNNLYRLTTAALWQCLAR